MRLLMILTLWCSVAAGQPTIIITQGGTYSGEWKSDGNVHAVQVWTSDPVFIVRSKITGKGDKDAIHLSGYHNVTIRNCEILSEDGAANVQRGFAVFAYNPRKLVVENNFVHDGNGIVVQGYDDSGNGDSILIRRNKGENMRRTKPDGTLGDRKTHFIQLNAVQNFKHIDIGWNQYVGEPGNSSVEDIININDSWPAAGYPGGRIHHCFLKGAYAFPLTAPFYTGSGITFERRSAYWTAEYCQVISCMNALMNIAGGHNNRFRYNRGISASVVPGVTQSQLFWAGGAVFNSFLQTNSDFHSNSIDSNYLNYVRWNDAGNYYPVPGRHDESSIRGTGQYENRMPPGGNFYGTTNATLADENTEWVNWQTTLTTNGITVGIVPLTPVPPPNPVLPIRLGVPRKVLIVAVDKEGNEVGYKTVSSSGSNSRVFTYTRSGLTFSINPVAVGVAKLTVRLMANSGRVLERNFDVKVDDGEAVNLIVKTL